MQCLRMPSGYARPSSEICFFTTEKYSTQLRRTQSVGIEFWRIAAEKPNDWQCQLLGARFNGPRGGSTAECNEIAPSHDRCPKRPTIYHIEGSLLCGTANQAARLPLRVKSRHHALKSPCPVYPRKRTLLNAMGCPLSAITGREQMRQTNVRRGGYSITSSARPSNAGGSVKPSILAVSRLITRSISVGNSIGKSSGAAPFRILSTRRLWPQVRTLQRSGRIDAQCQQRKS
jgi:hypothetical protein